MILYHGTCHKFSKVDFSKSKDKRNFGKGFYTTRIFEQAEKWANNQFLRYFKVNDQISFHSEEALKCLVWKQDKEV